MASVIKQSEVETPHFSLPFRFRGFNGGAFVNEQDSEDDIFDCVKCIVAYPEASRTDTPEFGIPELAFRENISNAAALLHAAIIQWEPRADALVESIPDWDGFVYDLAVSVTGSGED